MLDLEHGGLVCRDLEKTISEQRNNVVRLANGRHLALCECGLETTTDSEGDAWLWILDHLCAPEDQ